MKTLAAYFENSKGLGILATADKAGKVNAALYSRPYFMDEKTVAFIMADRLTHSNLLSNPQAAYLFVEDTEDYTGKRLYLTKLKESEDVKLIEELRRKRKCACTKGDLTMKKSFLVYFRIDSVLPLVGDQF